MVKATHACTGNAQEMHQEGHKPNLEGQYDCGNIRAYIAFRALVCLYYTRHHVEDACANQDSVESSEDIKWCPRRSLVKEYAPYFSEKKDADTSSQGIHLRGLGLALDIDIAN